MKIKTLSHTNSVASRYIKGKKAQFRLTCVARKRCCLTCLFTTICHLRNEKKTEPSQLLQRLLGSLLWTRRSAIGQRIRHLRISHNAPYLPSKVLHNPCLFFISPVYNSRPKRKLKTTLMQILGGQIRCIMGDEKVAFFYVLSNNFSFLTW